LDNNTDEYRPNNRLSIIVIIWVIWFFFAGVAIFAGVILGKDLDFGTYFILFAILYLTIKFIGINFYYADMKEIYADSPSGIPSYWLIVFYLFPYIAMPYYLKTRRDIFDRVRKEIRKQKKEQQSKSGKKGKRKNR
jgi:hypothetical protein